MIINWFVKEKREKQYLWKGIIERIYWEGYFIWYINWTLIREEAAGAIAAVVIDRFQWCVLLNRLSIRMLQGIPIAGFRWRKLHRMIGLIRFLLLLRSWHDHPLLRACLLGGRHFLRGLPLLLLRRRSIREDFFRFNLLVEGCGNLVAHTAFNCSLVADDARFATTITRDCRFKRGEVLREDRRDCSGTAGMSYWHSTSLWCIPCGNGAWCCKGEWWFSLWRRIPFGRWHILHRLRPCPLRTWDLRITWRHDFCLYSACIF